MGVLKVGVGSISTTIPAGASVPELITGADAVPHVSGAAAGAPVPTNDWWSPLVFNYTNQSSSTPLYADPLALRADATGLQIGYQSAVTYIDAPGLQVPDNVKYQYTFAPGLHVGLEGLAGAAATVSGYGDWTVTADWRGANVDLQATFGHGLPFVYFSRSGGGAAVVDVVQAPPASHVDNPTAPLVYQIHGLTGAFNGGVTHFKLPVDAASQVGLGPQARLSYDFNGDGKYDRIETYRYFPTDAAPGWETYNDSTGLASQTGAMADLANGAVKLEIWNAIGEGTPQLRVDAPAGEAHQATLTLPFSGLATTLYLRDGATGSAPAVLATQPGTVAAVDVMSDGRTGTSWDGQGEVWYSADGMAGVTIRGVHYGLFAPAGAHWTVTDTGLTSDLAGAQTFAVAVLPEKSPDALRLFAGHADDAITGSTATFGYDPANGSVTETFSVTTATGEQPLAALYRHQWLDTSEPLTGYTYESPRGEMKLAQDSSFAVTYAASPMLPVAPLLDPAATAEVRALVQADVAELASRTIKIPFEDTYTVGKELGRLAELAQIANQVGETAARDTYLGVIKAELEDWFTAGGKEFAYNAQWGTLQGYPASFDTEKQLNDHNFHYGYFVQAAATVAMFDPAWAQPDQWGGVVDLLVGDVANADHGGLFPWLRSFDPYAGHSWASGHGDFFAGNNNESSSEALNFAASLALWGAVTGRDALRDLGLELHSVESAAVLQYWFDVDHAVFPDGFPYQAAGMIWGDGATDTTWFSDIPEMILGINLMPISAATSLHLATHPQEILANYAEMAAESGGSPRYWKNIQWEYLALADPARALAELRADPHYSLNEGGSGSYAQTLHWISALANLGTLNNEVRADTPFHAVFARNGVNTYVAYNSGGQDLVVHFTDGTVLSVAPHAMATLRDGAVAVFDIGGESGGATPDPGSGTGQPTQPDGDGLQLVDGRIAFDDGVGAVTLASAAGANHDGTPLAARVFSLANVSAAFEPGHASGFELKVDAGSGVADAVQAAISYDFNGDGSVDRTETYGYFATDNVTGWESYGSQGRLVSATGAPLHDLVGGAVTVEVWAALGSHPLQVDIANSSLSLPFGTAGTGTTPDAPPPDLEGNGLVLADGAVRFEPQQVTLAAAGGANHDGAPHGAAVLTLDHVTAARLASATTGFKLMVDAGRGVGDAVQAAISYDFDGNGSFDRTETYQYLATDDVSGWQAYASSIGLRSVSGSAMQDLTDGTVKVDLWTAIGTHAVGVDLAASTLDLPFVFGEGSSGPPPTQPDPDSSPQGAGLIVSQGASGVQLTTSGEAVIASAVNGQHIDRPHDATVFTVQGLHAQYDGGNVRFDMPLDAASGVGNGTQLRLTFDFNGDGAGDRTETYRYFATNDAAGWERYSQTQGLSSASGSYADFTGGSVTAEIWNAIGNSAVTLDSGASVVLPYQSSWFG